MNKPKYKIGDVVVSNEGVQGVVSAAEFCPGGWAYTLKWEARYLEVLEENILYKL